MRWPALFFKRLTMGRSEGGVVKVVELAENLIMEAFGCGVYLK